MMQGQRRSKQKEPTLLEMCVTPYVDAFRMSKRVVNKAVKCYRKARRSRQ